jgi:hypothetical protein
MVFLNYSLTEKRPGNTLKKKPAGGEKPAGGLVGLGFGK